MYDQLVTKKQERIVSRDLSVLKHILGVIHCFVVSETIFVRNMEKNGTSPTMCYSVIGYYDFARLSWWEELERCVYVTSSI